MLLQLLKAPVCWRLSHETPAGVGGAGGADAAVVADDDGGPLPWPAVVRSTDHPPCIPAAGATSSHYTHLTITHTSPPHSLHSLSLAVVKYTKLYVTVIEGAKKST